MQATQKQQDSNAISNSSTNSSFQNESHCDENTAVEVESNETQLESSGMESSNNQDKSSENKLDSQAQADSTPEAAISGLNSLFEIASIWSQKVQKNANISKFVTIAKEGASGYSSFYFLTLDLAQGYKEDFTDLAKVLSSGAKIATEGINKSLETIKKNVQDGTVIVENTKNNKNDSNNEQQAGREVVEYDERGIPIVAQTADFEGVQRSLTEASELVSSAASKGLKIITDTSDTKEGNRDADASTQDKKDNPGIQNMLSETTKDIGSFIKGFTVNPNSKSLENTRSRLSTFVKNLGSEIEVLAKNAISISNPDSIDNDTTTNKVSDSLLEKQRNNLLVDLQCNEYTFTVDPGVVSKEPIDKSLDKIPYPLALQDEYVSQYYSTFKKSFEFSKSEKNYKEKATSLLETNKTMLELFSKLVPSTLTEEEFWCRYYFREWQFDHEHARRLKLLRAAITESQEDDFDWEMEDDEDHKIADQATNKEDPAASSNSTNKTNEPSSSKLVTSETAKSDKKKSADLTNVSEKGDASNKPTIADQTGSADSDNDWDTWE